MSDEAAAAENAMAPAPFMAALPPGVLMWASMYTALFYVCGGMIAYLYRPE